MGPRSVIFHLCKLGLSLHTREQDASTMPTSVVVVGDLMPTGRGPQSGRLSLGEGCEGGSPAGITQGDGQGVGGRVASREDRAGFPNQVTVANSAPESSCPAWTRGSDDLLSGPRCSPP